MSTYEEKLRAAVAPLSETEAAKEKFAAHLNELFSLLSPDAMGKTYRAARESEDVPGMIAAAAAHFRERADSKTFPSRGGYSKKSADDAARGKMRVVNIDYEFPGGRVDFLFDPTEERPPRNHEWLWQHNRHGFWVDMGRAYIDTGDRFYADAFSRQLTDWIAATGVVEKWNGPGSAWRTIECGLRLMDSWQIAFECFRKAKEVPDVLLLLMIASMHRQAEHLVLHPTRGNWLMMESNGTFAFSALFPELSDAAEYRRIASERLLSELEGQILPDGMHNELSPDYQIVVLICASGFYRLGKELGLDGEFPPALGELMARTVDAAIRLSTPRFSQPRTNDCYTLFTNRYVAAVKGLTPDRQEYDFVLSGREKGAPPAGKTASQFLPYAGLVAMRSDWGAEASYLCFDVGPLGLAHIHQDKLNFCLYKGSEELIFDDGGGQYEISPARTYALSAYDHNTVLVDGLGENRDAPKAVSEPIDAHFVTNDRFDYAAGTYEDGYGPEMKKLATHRREIRFEKPDLFLVRDTLTPCDENAHEYEILFHLDTTKVTRPAGYPGAVLSDFGKTYDVLILPLEKDPGEPICVSGATEPYRGWFVGRNAECLHEAITVSRKAAGKTHEFLTLLIPVKRGAPLPEIRRKGNTVSVATKTGNYELDLSHLDA